MNKKIFLIIMALIASLFVVNTVNAFWANYTVLAPADKIFVGDTNHPEFYNTTHLLFNYTVATNETFPIVNVSFYHNIGDPWQSSGTSSSTNFTGVNNVNDLGVDALSDGNYTWNFLLQSNESETVWMIDSNRSFVFDTAPPVVLSPSPASGFYSNSSLVNISWNYDDNLGFTGNCSIYINNTLNVSATSSAGAFSNHTLRFDDGNWTFFVNCTDGVNRATSATNYFVVDTLFPTIDFSANTVATGTFSNLNWVFVNMTVSSLNHNFTNITLFNSTGNLFASNRSLSFNFTGLVNGTYFFNATTFDLSGNKNSSGTRNITIDTVLPAITFSADTQANDKFTTEHSIYVNVTVSDTYLNATNITLYNSSGIVSWNESLSFNFTGLGNFTYFFNVTTVDFAGNKNSTVTRNISIGSMPFATNISISPDSGINYSGRDYQFNVTWTDSYCGVDKSFLNINGTDYAMTNGTSKMNWSVTRVNFTAGIFKYYFWANNTCNYVNQSSNATYVVNRSVQQLTLTIAPSTIYYSTFFNVTGAGCLGQLNCSLLRNGTAITNPQTGLLINTIGYYNFTYRYLLSENYTANQITSVVTILDVPVSGGGGIGGVGGTIATNTSPVVVERQFLKSCGVGDSYMVGYVDFCNRCRGGNLVLENNTYNCYTCTSPSVFDTTTLYCTNVSETPTTIPQKTSNNNMVYIVIGGLVLLGGYFFLNKKNG